MERKDDRKSGARRRPGTAAGFARDVRDQLARHLSPAEVSFRGSFAEGTHDEYSDVDLLAEVHAGLDGRFFSGLERLLTGLYGPALIRYDPAYEETTAAQGVRFSFYELPVFWRVDLDVVSDRSSDEKWPNPFPERRVGTSALMNVVWAIKYCRRGDEAKADHYLTSACDKVGNERLPYSDGNVLGLLERIEEMGDADPRLLAKTREAVAP